MAKRLIRQLSVIVALALVAVPASAAQHTTTARVGGFDAMGTGTVVVNGNLTVFGSVTGIVLVRDRVGGAVVRIKGVRQRPVVVVENDRTVRLYRLRNVDGGFYVKGRNVRVELRSPKDELSMTALGRGTVQRLRGTGTWHLNGGEEQQWTDALLPIAIKPPPPPPPAEPTSTEPVATSPTPVPVAAPTRIRPAS